MISRRDMLSATAAGALVSAAGTSSHAGTFGNPDEPPQGAINTHGNPASISDPGPHDPTLSNQFPSAFSPPATNVGDLPAAADSSPGCMISGDRNGRISN
jgi:oxalate decarboxylase